MTQTVPPASNKKFDFGMDFEQEEERTRLELLRQEELLRQTQIDAPPPAIYNEEHMDAARHAAFAEGRAAGIEESRQSLEAVIVSLVDRTLQAAQILLQNEIQRDNAVLETALRTTLAAIKKFWPQIVQVNGVGVIEQTLREMLAVNPDETRLVLRVHDTLLDPVVARLPMIREQEAFNGKIIVIADADIQPGDCKIEWADGGLERLSRGLGERLDQAMTRLIATLQNTQQTERISS